MRNNNHSSEDPAIAELAEVSGPEQQQAIGPQQDEDRSGPLNCSSRSRVAIVELLQTGTANGVFSPTERLWHLAYKGIIHCI